MYVHPIRPIHPPDGKSLEQSIYVSIFPSVHRSLCDLASRHVGSLNYQSLDPFLGQSIDQASDETMSQSSDMIEYVDTDVLMFFEQDVPDSIDQSIKQSIKETIKPVQNHEPSNDDQTNNRSIPYLCTNVFPIRRTHLKFRSLVYVIQSINQSFNQPISQSMYRLDSIKRKIHKILANSENVPVLFFLLEPSFNQSNNQVVQQENTETIIQTVFSTETTSVCQTSNRPINQTNKQPTAQPNKEAIDLEDIMLACQFLTDRHLMHIAPIPYDESVVISNNQSNNQSTGTSSLNDQTLQAIHGGVDWVNRMLTDQTINQSTNQSVAQSNISVRHPILIDQSSLRSINQSKNQSNNQSIDHSNHHLVWRHDLDISDSLSDYLIDDVNQLVTQYLTCSIRTGFISSLDQATHINNQAIKQSIKQALEIKKSMVRFAHGYDLCTDKQSSNQSNNQAINQTTTRLINQSNNQSNNQTNNQSMILSIEQLCNQIVAVLHDQSLKQQFNSSTNQLVNQTLLSSTTRPTNLSNNQPSNQTNNQSSDQSLSNTTDTSLIPSVVPTNNQTTNRSNYQSINQSASQPVSQPISHVDQSFIVHFVVCPERLFYPDSAYFHLDWLKFAWLISQSNNQSNNHTDRLINQEALVYQSINQSIDQSDSQSCDDKIGLIDGSTIAWNRLIDCLVDNPRSKKILKHFAYQSNNPSSSPSSQLSDESSHQRIIQSINVPYWATVLQYFVDVEIACHFDHPTHHQRSINQSINQSINSPIDESINLSNNQSISQSINLPPACFPTFRSFLHCNPQLFTLLFVNDYINQSNDQSNNQSNNQSVKKQMNYWLPCLQPYLHLLNPNNQTIKKSRN